MTKDLLPREKSAPGRRRSVTASAWIARRQKHGAYYSNVYIGTGRVHSLSTSTMDREKALAFNRCHLLQLLNRSTTRESAGAEQLHFDHENV